MIEGVAAARACRAAVAAARKWRARRQCALPPRQARMRYCRSSCARVCCAADAARRAYAAARLREHASLRRHFFAAAAQPPAPAPPPATLPRGCRRAPPPLSGFQPRFACRTAARRSRQRRRCRTATRIRGFRLSRRGLLRAAALRRGADATVRACRRPQRERFHGRQRRRAGTCCRYTAALPSAALHSPAFRRLLHEAKIWRRQ